MIYRVTAPVVNVRHRPDRQHEVLGRVLRGMLVEGADPVARGWIPVRCPLRDGDLFGWASGAYLEPHGGGPAGESQPPWLVVAGHEIGVRDYPEAADNPRILEYCAVVPPSPAEDEVPWASACANWCLRQAGYAGSGSAAARSWLGWGEPCPPRPGCVAILRRDSHPERGHVAFLVQRRGAIVELLGASAGNRVQVASFSARQVLEYRWPDSAHEAHHRGQIVLTAKQAGLPLDKKVS